MQQHRTCPRPSLHHRKGLKLWKPPDGSIEDLTAGTCSDDELQQPNKQCDTKGNTPNEDEPDELDALLDQYETQAKADHAKVATKLASQPGFSKSMATAREEGLQTAIQSDNKGFQLLKKMGYKDGTALGKSMPGRVDPLELNLKAGRSGLGVDEEKKRKQREQQAQAEAERAKRSRQQAQAQQHYVTAQRSDFADRKILKDLRQAWGSVQTLCEQTGRMSDRDSLLARLPALQPEKEGQEENDAEDNDSEQDKPQIPLNTQLLTVLLYLREHHCYCYYCGCAYADFDELEQNCPGVHEDDH